MSGKTQKSAVKKDAAKEFVTVAFAEDMDLAKQYKQLLADHEITAAIKRQPEMARDGFSDIAIRVPEDLLDEAHALISKEAACEGFFDMLFEADDRDLPGFIADDGFEDDDEDEDYA